MCKENMLLLIHAEDSEKQILNIFFHMWNLGFENIYDMKLEDIIYGKECMLKDWGKWNKRW